MVIANPIYDVVFKRLMEDDKVAKFFIGTLIEQTIETIEVKAQEFTYTEELIGLAIFRVDFIATIKTVTGEFKKILIEIQKAKNQIDLMRFRRYLAEQYKKEETISDQKVILPITTIYILGFKLPEIDTPCLKVERNYKDLIHTKIINTKSDFIEKLTHDCYIVQVNRITDRYQTRLDKLLSVFEQSNFTDERNITKEFNHKSDLEEVEMITKILHHSVTNPEERKKLETEQEAWRSVNAMFENERNELIAELDEQRKIVEEKDKELNKRDQQIEELLKKLNQQK